MVSSTYSMRETLKNSTQMCPWTAVKATALEAMSDFPQRMVTGDAGF
jgi:hypothetical protein